MKRIFKILDIAKEKQLQDHDTVFIICGQEGSGKSHLGLHCMEHLGAGIDDIALDKEEFVKTLQKAKDCDSIMFDEAGDGLFSRDFASNLSKQLVKTFMVIRAKRLITFLILPSFFLLDLYFRQHRVRGLFFVYRRGRCIFYSKNKIEKLIQWGEKYKSMWVKGVKGVRDTYPIYKGHLLEKYKEKKKIKIEDTLKSMGAISKEEKAPTKIQQIREMITKGMSNPEIAGKMDCSVQYISSIRTAFRENIKHRVKLEAKDLLEKKEQELKT